jgi:hypothetical protein
MPNTILKDIVDKIGQILKDFFQKEEELKKTGDQIVLDAVKKSDEKKIAEIKNKINQI